MKKKTQFIFILLVVITLAPFSYAQDAVDFSATMIQTAPDRKVIKTLLFVNSDAMRSELNSSGGKRITIVNMMNSTAWMLNPDRKEYVLIGSGTGTRNRPPLPDDAESPCMQNLSGLKCTKLGDEVVNGRDTEKWEMSITMDSGKKSTMVWIDKRLRMPVRQEMPDGSVNELLDITEGAQPASLFEIPADYTKIDLPVESVGR